MLKQEIRQIVFEKRKNISNYRNLEKLFIKNFYSIDFLTKIKGEIIAGYYPFQNECNILEILKFYSKNNTIVLPVVLEKNKQMIFRKWDGSNKSLVANPMLKNKILEPNENCQELQPTIVFTPAVAVDIYGNRIGYGGGYYDRTLQNINCLKIATIYDFQLFNDKFNVEKNDMKMDYILTEKNFNKFYNTEHLF